MGNQRADRRRPIVVHRLVVLVIALCLLGAACGSDDPVEITTAVGDGSAPTPTGDTGTDTRGPDTTAVSLGPTGGGVASGTGADVELACPDGVEERTEEWYGPAGLTARGAVDEAYGDLGLRWIGEPVEIASTDAWSSWGLTDDDGRMIAVATIVVTADGWDPSHARYCAIRQPTPPPPPFTLHVSNQSFDEPSVDIRITIAEEVIVDDRFDVEGQHNWSTFTPDIEPGTYRLRATSNTGAELTTEVTFPDGEPRWAVIGYWSASDGDPSRFSFTLSERPVYFG